MENNKKQSMKMIIPVLSSDLDWIKDDEIYYPKMTPGEVIDVISCPSRDVNIKHLVVIERRGDLPYDDPDTAVVSEKTACELGLDFGYDTIIIIQKQRVKRKLSEII